jgi:hypothetical protein
MTHQHLRITTPPPIGFGDMIDEEYDYAVADFVDLNDDDDIHVRWDNYRKQAYMFSTLDVNSQWIGRNWTIRRTIEIGLGHQSEGEWFDVEEMCIYHNDRMSADGHPDITLPSDIEVQQMLMHTWDSYAANRIVLTFKAE